MITTYILLALVVMLASGVFYLGQKFDTQKKECRHLEVRFGNLNKAFNELQYSQPKWIKNPRPHFNADGRYLAVHAPSGLAYFTDSAVEEATRRERRLNGLQLKQK